MVQRLLQIKAHLILCFRAEERVKMEKVNGKTEIIPIGFQPICSKELPYELTASFLLTPDKPGYPQPIKLQEQHRLLFPLDKPINEESGRKVAEWAAGGTAPVQPATISAEQNKLLRTLLTTNKIDPAAFKSHFGIESSLELRADQMESAKQWIDEIVQNNPSSA